jgi:hypothetical protein
MTLDEGGEKRAENLGKALLNSTYLQYEISTFFF